MGQAPALRCSALVSLFFMDNEPLQISQPVSVWTQIDILAAQVETPSTAYDLDPLKMAQAVIEDSRKRATLIRKLVPESARNSF